MRPATLLLFGLLLVDLVAKCDAALSRPWLRVNIRGRTAVALQMNEMELPDGYEPPSIFDDDDDDESPRTLTTRASAAENDENDEIVVVDTIGDLTRSAKAMFQLPRGLPSVGLPNGLELSKGPSKAEDGDTQDAQPTPPTAAEREEEFVDEFVDDVVDEMVDDVLSELTRSAKALFGATGVSVSSRGVSIGALPSTDLENVREDATAGEAKATASRLAPPPPPSPPPPSPPPPSPQRPVTSPPMSAEARVQYNEIYNAALQATSTRGGASEVWRRRGSKRCLEPIDLSRARSPPSCSPP